MILKYGQRTPQLIVVTRLAGFHGSLLAPQSPKFETSRQDLMGKHSKHLSWPVWGALRPEDSLPALPQVTIPTIWLSPRTNERYEELPENSTPEIE